MSWLFTSGGQSIGVSASASVLPMNIQGWFLLGLTGLISLQSKGLSRVFSSTIVQRHQFFGPQLFSCPALTPIHDYWKNHSLDYMDLYPFRFRSFTHFSISLSAFFYWVAWVPCIFWILINPLSDMWFANIFSLPIVTFSFCWLYPRRVLPNW